MQKIIVKKALNKIGFIVLSIMLGLVMVFVAVSILVISQYNRKYEEINEQVSAMTEQYLELYLDDMSQDNMLVQQSGIKKETQVRDKIIVNLLSEDEKTKIISSVLGTLTPELYKNINFTSEAIRQDTLSQLESTLQEKILEILDNSDLLTEEQKELITKEITIAVETQILHTINEQYTEMTAAITTIEKYVENNLLQMQEMLDQYEEKIKALEWEIAALKSKIDQSNSNSKSDTEDLKKQLEDMENEYSKLTNSFLSYISSMKQTMDSLGLDPENGNLIDRINDLQVSLESADDQLSTSIKSLNSELTISSERLQKQITDNSDMISELDTVQKKLQEYTDAVKAGDEEARVRLQKELEEYSKGLDDATRAHINDVINSTTEDIDKKLADANQSIAELGKNLTNSITANATAIEKEQSANISDVNEIVAELQKLIAETQNTTDQAKYEEALSQIAEEKNGTWTPRESVTPTKALSVYNTVVNETKIESRITSVSETIDATMMKAEFSEDGTTLTITIPNGN